LWGRDRGQKIPWRETRILEPDRVRQYPYDLTKGFGLAFGDAGHTGILGCPASCRAFLYGVTAIPLNKPARPTLAAPLCCSIDPTLEAATIRAFEYLIEKKFVLSSNNALPIRAFE